MKHLLFLAIITAQTLLLVAPHAGAHEVRPAYLEIIQHDDHSYRVRWKQPSIGNRAIHLVPHLSNGWLETPPADQYVAAGFIIRTWRVDAPDDALFGQRIEIEGLKDTITDVYVKVELQNGQHLEAIIRPESPYLQVELTNGSAMGALAFVKLGIEHILSGPDHLAFILGLLLIVRDRRTLVKTVTAFTLAHSLTLALTSFGVISASDSLLNALIALSILFLAPEVIRARSGGTSLTIRYPWIVAFGFGLVHGMGFASGLSALGLDRADLLNALICFNAGVEIGQLIFVGIALALGALLVRLPATLVRRLAPIPVYAIGSLGAMWALQYSAEFFAGGWQP